MKILAFLTAAGAWGTATWIAYDKGHPGWPKTGCPNGGRCDGSGWVQVRDEYAAHLAPEPPPLLPGAAEADVLAHAVLVTEAKARLASVRASVYPCEKCRPQLFGKWTGKHFDRHHDPRDCRECAIELGGPVPRPTVPRLPERRDVD